MRDATMYRPNVAKSDSTISRKMEFVNMELNVSGPVVLATFSIPLKASRNAATCKFPEMNSMAPEAKKKRLTVIYTVMRANPTKARV